MLVLRGAPGVLSRSTGADNPPSSLQDDASDLEDDDLSGLESDADGPTTDAQHVEDLKALALKDPEFFKYLQENDAELLDFGGEGEEADIETDTESEEDSDMENEGEIGRAHV